MNIHFIAIGGSAMHNLAIALKQKGYNITGSDDEIFEPSRTRLVKYEILPEKTGWFEENIHEKLDAVILGMHAKDDNPELMKAKELKLKIYSYPEFLYEQSKSKTRIVIGGSHGKTTITSMLLHVLNYHDIKTDYMVGAQLEGFDVMVKITKDAPYMILEGDEYLSSPLDKRPKFHLYRPHIALLSGIAWDHINVFPTFENYVEQFEIFIQLIEENGKLIYNDTDPVLKRICEESPRTDLCLYPYTLPDFTIKNGKTSLLYDGVAFPLQVFGEHNLMNIAGAMYVCNQIGISRNMFMEAIISFKGATNRLQLLAESSTVSVYKDFAHAPSKLSATTKAVKDQYPDRKLTAIMELHTYSSLNKKFLQEYKGTMKDADKAIIFFNPHALALKRLPDITADEIKDAFDGNNIEVINDVQILKQSINDNKTKDSTFLFMSSGNFGNIDMNQIAKQLTE